MSGVRPLLVPVLLVALAAPASALAQSAGDEQYEDPFSGSQESPQSGSSQGSTGAGGESGGGGGSAGSGSTSAQAPQTADTVTNAPASQTAALPHTGFPAPLAALAGAALLALGLGLRLVAWAPSADARRGTISLSPFALSSAPPAVPAPRLRRAARGSARRRAWRT